MQQQIRGVQSNQELSNSIDIRDTKNFLQKTAIFMRDPNFHYYSFGFFTILMAILPMFAEIWFLLGLGFYPIMRSSQSKFVLPFKLPKTSELLDYHEMRNGKPTKAQGIVYIGSEMNTDLEIWASDSDARTHILIFGTTGAGKALHLNELLLTTRGWVKNKYLKVGDKVMTPYGNFSEIVGIFPQKKHKMLRVHFENGLSKDVSEDHLWEFYFDKDGYEYTSFDSFRENQKISVSETRNMKLFLETGKSIFIPHSNQVGGIELTEKDLQGFTFEELAKFFISDVNNEKSLLHKKEYQVIKRIINDSSSSQKRIFENLCLLELQKLSLYKNSYIICKNIDCAALLHSLYSYLGYVAKIVKVEDCYHLELNRSFVLKVTEIEELEEAYCQCIKIADEHGLITLNGNITTHNTEAILSLLTNAFIQGSGFIMVDGKADISTFAKIFSLCRSFRREDDLLIINYMTSGQDVFGKQEMLMSNTLNPFITVSASGATEMLVGLMDSGGGSDPMWQGRAIALISALLYALVWMRDNEGLLLGIAVIREHLLLEKIAELADREYGGISSISEALRSYLVSIPGYNASVPINKQESVVSEQHGYLQMQFTRILGSLADNYGYIFKTNLGHIDFKDVVLNRRILVVLLPALEKSEPELQNLGKIVVSCIKSMMASTLGSALDSTVAKGVENRATNSLSPYYIVFDEYGYYIVKGSAVMPAQARSLGFCMVFAGQDLPSFQKNNNREEATSIIANCNIKIFMKVEDPGETTKLFIDTAGQVLVEVLKGKDRRMGLTNSYIEQMAVNYEKRNRGDFLDLKGQVEGEAHIIQRASLVRARFFYTNPDLPSDMKFRPNYFVKVEPPSKTELQDFIQIIENVKDSLYDSEYIAELKHSTPPSKILSSLFGFVNESAKNGFNSPDIALGSMIYMQQRIANLDEELVKMQQQYQNMKEANETSVSVFANKQIRANNTPQQLNSLFLDEATIKNDICFIEDSISDKTEREISKRSDVFIEQLKSSASYPQDNIEIPEDMTGAKVSAIIQELNMAFAADLEEDISI